MKFSFFERKPKETVEKTEEKVETSSETPGVLDSAHLATLLDKNKGSSEGLQKMLEEIKKEDSETGTEGK